MKVVRFEFDERSLVDKSTLKAQSRFGRPLTTYREFEIWFDPPPMPTRNHDYQFQHVDYDGPGDNRCGTARSVEDCKEETDELLFG